MNRSILKQSGLSRRIQQCPKVPRFPLQSVMPTFDPTAFCRDAKFASLLAAEAEGQVHSTLFSGWRESSLGC